MAERKQNIYLLGTDVFNVNIYMERICSDVV